MGQKVKKFGGNFGFFFVSAEISALRAKKQHLLKNFFFEFFAKLMKEYSLKVWKSATSLRAFTTDVVVLGDRPSVSFAGDVQQCFIFLGL